MITTVDGVVKKPGDRVWIVWFSTIDMKYKPFNAPYDQYADRSQFHDKGICQEQCNLMNQSDKNI